MKKVTVAIVGLGSRGKDTYAPVAKLISDKMEIVAIADIIPEKVELVAKEYGVAKEMCFTSAEELLKQDKLADVLIIATHDRQHVAQAIPALKKGYHLLLEKPISPNIEECRDILKVAKECGRHVVVCHVLRYTPFYQKLKEIIKSGVIGNVVNVQAIENVGYWHQAHSFVRGNWRNTSLSSPMILQKSCHDMDILTWLVDKKCKAVTSFGSLSLFKAEKAPEGATLRCLDGCKVKEDCPYDAEKIYITDPKLGVKSGRKSWPLDILALDPTEESITTAVKEGPYGRCVYHCDNDVVDHQVVNLLMSDDSTISFTMSAFTSKGHRYTKVMGTNGDIEANMGENIIEVTQFGKPSVVYDITKLATNFSGHGGGDSRMLEELIDLIINDLPVEKALTNINDSVESHYIAFAAEMSRLRNGVPIELANLR